LLSLVWRTCQCDGEPERPDLAARGKIINSSRLTCSCGLKNCGHTSNGPSTAFVCQLKNVCLRCLGSFLNEHLREKYLRRGTILEAFGFFVLRHSLDPSYRTFSRVCRTGLAVPLIYLSGRHLPPFSPSPPPYAPLLDRSMEHIIRAGPTPQCCARPHCVNERT